MLAFFKAGILRLPYFLRKVPEPDLPEKSILCGAVSSSQYDEIARADQFRRVCLVPVIQNGIVLKNDAGQLQGAADGIGMGFRQAEI